MPIDQVVKMVDGLQLDSESISTWKAGVERALKKYIPSGTAATGHRCPNCGNETLGISGRLSGVQIMRRIKMRITKQ